MSNIDLNQITGPASGFKDYVGDYAEDRHQMIEEITTIFKLYGATYLDTPVIERNNTLRGKGGNESEKLIYNVQDSTGENTLGLRFDLTVPLARFCAQNSGNIQYPFMRYAYGDVFRGETASNKKGRLRGFMQCDLDVVGTSSIESDLKILLIMNRVMTNFKLDFVIRVNNRLLLDGIAEFLDITNERLKSDLFAIIDEIEKITKDEFERRILIKFDEKIYTRLNDFLNISGNSIEKIYKLNEIFGSNDKFKVGFDNLLKIFKTVDELGLNNNIIFDQSIVRGLDYYTGIIYETNLLKYRELGSVFSGGRYDKLIEKLGGPDLPSVGTSVGVDRLFSALIDSNYFSKSQTKKKIYVSVMTEQFLVECFKIAELLRDNGFIVYMPENSTLKLKKQFADSSDLGCEYTIIIGEDEIKQKSVSIKDMKSSEQIIVSVENLLQKLL